VATILVVDDRPSNRQFLTTLLGYGGHQMLEAADGAEALESVRSRRPDLVITDILMPTMDGYEFVQQIRADPALAPTPVIFYSATYSTPQAEALARNCGVTTVLSKPCEPQVILEAVNRMLGIREPGAGERPALAGPAVPKPASADQTLTLYLRELQDVQQSFENLAKSSAKQGAERDSVKELSAKFAENVNAMQRITSRLSALLEVGMEMMRERDPERLVELFFAAICDIVDSKYAAIGMLDENELDVRYVFARGLDRELFRGEAGRSGLLGTILSGERKLRARGANGARSAEGLPNGHPPVRDLLAIPVASADRTYGWMYFADKRGEEGFTEEDTRLATAMTTRLALLYENAMLYDQIQRHAAALQIEVGERRRTERALAISEAGLRRAQAMAKLAHVITGPDGSIESWSESLPLLTGLEPGGMPRSTGEWMGLVHPDDRALFRDSAIEAGVDRRRRDIEYRLKRAKGWIHVRQATEPLSEGGEAEGGRWFNTLQDITEQKAAAEELHRFRLSLDNSADMIVIMDRASMRIIDVNQTTCRLLGYTREELLRMGPEEILPVSRVDLEKAYDELIANPSLPSGMENYYRCKDGSQLPFESTRHVLRSGDQWLVAAISRDIRQRQADEARLRESEERFRSLSMLSSDWFWEQDQEHRFVNFSGGEGVRGWGPDQSKALGLHRWDLGGVIPISCSWEEHKGMLDAHKPFRSFEYRRILADGRVQYVEASGEPIFDAAGRFTGYRGVATEITERKETENRIRRLNRVYAVLSGINALIVRVRDRDELFRESCRMAVEAGGFRMAWIGVVDPAAKEVKPVAWQGVDAEYIQRMPVGLVDTGPQGRGLAGRAVREKTAIAIDDMTQDPRVLLKDEARERGLRSLVMLPLIVRDEVVGVLALYAGEVAFFDHEEMKLLNELAGDIAFALDHIEKAEKLDYLAYYDELTGLANRRLFLERVEQKLQSARDAGHKASLVILDVERFKSVNDALGRQAGDELLKQIADRLIRAGSDATRLARISADHFAIIALEAEGEQQLARLLDSRFERLFGAPFLTGGSEIRLSAKLGIAMFPADGADAEALFRNAEAALKKAKTAGERYIFYAQEMTERVAEKLALENRLRQALEKDEFVLHYQPKVSAETMKVVGAEALIRWQSAEGLVPPMQFIPLMEETGLIREAGAWALQRAVLDHRHWLRMGIAAPRVAVNVSPIQLRQQDFVDTVKEAIAQGANPTGLDLEITESLIMEDVQGNIRKLKAIRDLGVSVAIDDFGTGYSSLAYLAKLPVEALKIDRSFIIGMLTDPNTMMLIQTMINLAHSLRLKVVAEGVETEEQAKMLRLLRCDELQGYLISKPMPIEDVTPLLRKG
jgi:diguanylate cyclase (GGDEF)-like protein/PAS domain S-box-containing protein